MIPVQFLEPQFKLKKEGDKNFIFCLLRKQWLLLTEEEWVRQNFIQYLITALHYPSTLIAIEKELVLNGLKKRFDVLVYNTSHQPWMLVECKAPQVTLSEEVLQQALRYHMTIPADFIILTNDMHTVGWKKVEGNLTLIDALPDHT